MTTRQTVTLAALVMAGISLSSIVSYCAGRRQGIAAAQLRQDERTVAEARTARTTAVQAATRAVERVSEAQPMVRVAHDAAVIVDATTLEVRVTPSASPTAVTVPPEVVRRFVQDSLQLARQAAAIDSLQQLRAADALLIQRQAVVIADLKAMKTPRCGRRCGIIIGVLATAAASVVVDQVVSGVR